MLAYLVWYLHPSRSFGDAFYTRLTLVARVLSPVEKETVWFMQDELARWTPAIRRSGAMEQ